MIAQLHGKVGELEAEIGRLVREREEKDFEEKAIELTMAAGSGLAEESEEKSEEATE